MLRKGVCSLAWVAGLATPSAAEQWEFYGGVASVSNYVSNGVTQSDGKPAIQPYLEISVDGFYAGLWASNVDFGDNDNWEVDLYAGYRKLLPNKLFVDVGYARYFYDDSGDCCGELKLTAAFPVHDKIGLKGYLAYDPESENWNRRATLAYEVNEQFTLSGTYGYSDSYSHDYWDAGGSFALTDVVALDARYQGSGSGDEGFVVGLSLATSQSSLARLLLSPFQN
jgi:uncharacterized protein (TIGR02001 family)